MNSPTSPSSGRRLRRGPATAVLLLGITAATMAFVTPGTPEANAGRDRCRTPDSISALDNPLPHTALRLATGKNLTIVALGSSSTYGTGASSPEHSYPSRLAALLRGRYPHAAITVINRGVGGEMVGDTTARIVSEVIADKPDLVIWQVGTNDVLGDVDPEAVMASVRTGITELHQVGADIILMDLATPAAHQAFIRTLSRDGAGLDGRARAAGGADVPAFRHDARLDRAPGT